MNTFDNDDDDLNYEYEYPEKFKELNFEEPDRYNESEPLFYIPHIGELDEEEEYFDEDLELDEWDYVEWDDEKCSTSADA